MENQHNFKKDWFILQTFQFAGVLTQVVTFSFTIHDFPCPSGTPNYDDFLLDHVIHLCPSRNWPETVLEFERLPWEQAWNWPLSFQMEWLCKGPIKMADLIDGTTHAIFPWKSQLKAKKTNLL